MIDEEMEKANLSSEDFKKTEIGEELSKSGIFTAL